MEEQTPAPVPVEVVDPEAEAKAAEFDRKQVETLTADKVKLLQEKAGLEQQVAQLNATCNALQRTLVATCEKLTRA